MKIERVDEKTVKCFISNEELEEFEISESNKRSPETIRRIIMSEISGEEPWKIK